MDEETRKKKIESAIPVQSRIDIRALAEMAIYWEGEQQPAKTMSQLVNWTVDLCSQILNVNGLLPEKIDTLLKANNSLVSRGLYQAGVMKRGRKKLIRGKQFENLRLEGVDPATSVDHEEYAKTHHVGVIEPTGTFEPPDVPKTDRQKLIDKTYKDLEDEKYAKILADAEDVKNSIEFDENGVSINKSDGRDNYTDKDVEKAKIEREKRKVEKSGKVYNTKPNKTKTPINSTEPRKLTDEEIDEKNRLREAKEKAKLDLMNSSILPPGVN